MAVGEDAVRPQVEHWPTETVETLFGAVEAVRGDLITRQLQRFGAHQRHELAMLAAFLRPGDHVLDIGAHIGTFALPLARCVGPEGRVDAFEGLAQHVAILRRNVERLGAGRVHCHHALIGGAGAVPLRPDVRPGNSAETQFVASSGDSAHDAQAALEGSAPLHWSLDGWWQEQPEALRRGAVQLIKIDVEGMELEVLRGGEGMLRRDRPMLYMEVHRRHLQGRGIPLQSLEDILGDVGYHFFRNLGRRNGRRDRFLLGRHWRLADGGPFFDVLAIHPQSERYPRSYVAPSLSGWMVRGRGVLGRLRRAVRRWTAPPAARRGESTSR